MTCRNKDDIRRSFIEIMCGVWCAVCGVRCAMLEAEQAYVGVNTPPHDVLPTTALPTVCFLWSPFTEFEAISSPLSP